MEYRNYCLVGLGNVSGMREDIKKVSEGIVAVLEHKSVFIGTFSSVMEPTELKDFFNKGDKRTFFLFEADTEISGWHIADPTMHAKLFKHIEEGNEDLLNVMSNNLMDGIAGSSIHKEPRIQEELINIDELTSKEIEEKINELLDIGVENLSERQKWFLDLLTDKLN